MRIASVICEFNPFHNGHKYLIDKIRNEHADCIIAIMSGNFVQRGDIAIVDKFFRAQSALNNGCDLVVELPTVFALSSAERFAKGGVQVADALNSDVLCFGVENNDINALRHISELYETENFKEKVKKHLSNGDYYPKAVSNSVSEILGEDYSDILNGANNTLAIEYIKALKNTDISPIAIKRKGVLHDSDETTKNIASATHIRNLIREKKEYDSFLIDKPDYFTDIYKLETAILYKLKLMSKDDFKELPDVAEGLENRFYECAKTSTSLEELFSLLKTKRYTLARLRRIIMYALLNIKKEDMFPCIEYIRVLGMNNKGAKLLSKSKLPIVTKFPQDYNTLGDNGKKMLQKDILASDVFSLAVSEPTKYVNELKRKLLKT